MKAVAIIHLPRNKGKTSVLLTEYHKYRLLGNTMGILLPNKHHRYTVSQTARHLGINFTHTRILTSFDSLRGCRLDRLLIDDIDVCAMQWGVIIGDIFDLSITITDKLLFTVTDGLARNVLINVCNSYGITTNVYREADLVNYMKRYITK